MTEKLKHTASEWVVGLWLTDLNLGQDNRNCKIESIRFLLPAATKYSNLPPNFIYAKCIINKLHFN